MKTFKNLCIGDTFYKVYTDYTAKEKPRCSGHYGEGCDICEPLSNCDVNILSFGDGVFTTDYNVLENIIADTGVRFINECERKIESEQEEIKRIRTVYWDFLQKKSVKDSINEHKW